MSLISALPPKRIRIVYCYTHEDSAFCSSLDQHLTSLKRSGLIETWPDQSISPGAVWEQEIASHIDEADIILLLISPNFMVSGYPDSDTMQHAMKRAESRGGRVIAILLRPTPQWSVVPFGKLQALPEGGRPITVWRNRDTAFAEVAKSIRQAVAELQTALAAQVQWVDEGNRFIALKQYEDALSAYEQALYLDPDNVAAYVGRGNALCDLGRLTEALAAYHQAIFLSPDDSVAHLKMGDVLSHLHRYVEALTAYDHVIRLSSENKAAYMSKGYVFRELQRYEDALAAYEQAIHLTPDDTEVYLSKGDVLLRLHRYEEALVSCNAAIASDPNNARALQTKATILLHLGRYEGALLASEKTMRLGQNLDTMALEGATSGRDSPQPSQTHIELVQQFLMKAGFDFTPFYNEGGFLALAKIPIWKARFPKGVYVRIFFDQPLNQRAVRSIYQDARKYTDHALMIINTQPAISGWGEINILRGEQGQQHFVCLPIDESLIQKGSTSNNEILTLQFYIDKHLGKGFDPYEGRDPVSGAVSFFGRQRLTEELLVALRFGQRWGLFGIQKIGKSSVLQELQKRAEFPIAYVYIKTGDDLSSIYDRIVDDWVVNGQMKYSEFNWTKPLKVGTVSQGDFHATAKSLRTYLSTVVDTQPLLGIFLDEIEHIVPSEGDEKTLQLYVSLMDSLRGLQQETGTLALLVAGVHPIVARRNYFWGNQKNPMHQIIVERFLTPLDEEDCAYMIRSLGQQINLQYEEEALKYILEMSGSHPYLARQICSLAYKKRKDTRTISLEIVEEVVQEFIRNPSTASYFDEHGLWKELSEPDLWREEVGKANGLLLRALASSNQDLSENELCTSLGIDKTVAFQAFYALKERSIISSLDNSEYYRITFGLFREWIRFHQLGVS